jgi:lysophospholipase L1-like esterase
MGQPWRRFVAVGDSTVEGLEDPDGRGGYRGWADRLADALAADLAVRDSAAEPLLYANLAVRGRRTGDVLADQLPAALALAPDLVVCVVGVNDVLRPRVDLPRLLADTRRLHRALRASGADVLTFTQPDPAAVVPLARPLRSRVLAHNEVLRELARTDGVLLLDLEREPVATDPRLWAADRLHASPAGHERVAAGLAETLGLSGVDAGWRAPLPPLDRPRAMAAVRAELDWARRHLGPWVLRRLTGQSSGDRREPKRPAYAPVRPAAEPA